MGFEVVLVNKSAFDGRSGNGWPAPENDVAAGLPFQFRNGIDAASKHSGVRPLDAVQRARQNKVRHLRRDRGVFSLTRRSLWVDWTVCQCPKYSRCVPAPRSIASTVSSVAKI